jgi:enoyl-[acyl-carrier-protein] reductase (NADH)
MVSRDPKEGGTMNNTGDNTAKVEVPSYVGERYEAEVPDTLDLAERAVLAINALTRALATDHAAEGIRVNVVCPGAIDTPMLRWIADEFRGDRSAESVLDEWGRAHPVGRIGQPEEVAAMIVFLASPAASFITGAAIPVDGGQLTTVAVSLPEREPEG